MSNLRAIIFIVDDDPDDRQIILDAFLENNLDYDYVFVENADELMHMLHTLPTAELPSLILLDLNMPGMLGMTALKEIKGNKKISSIPTIVLTTSTQPKDRSLSYEYGANCFLRKPDLYTDLVEQMSAIAKLWLRKADA
jgi:CheY-like chemotaxis protein